MSTIHRETEAVAARAWAVGRMIYVELTDQRILGFPANRFRRLKAASEQELAEVKLEVGGTALRWESLDESWPAAFSFHQIRADRSRVFWLWLVVSADWAGWW